MTLWNKKILWYFLVLLAGALAQTVTHPFPRTCAVKGSTVTLSCTFTPLKSGRFFFRGIPLKIVRVRWCQNRLICQGSTTSVYDSASRTNDPRYQYLGDLKGNCTLQIRDVQMKDNTVFYFRMEANDPEGHFSDQSGVRVTVVDGTLLRIKSSSKEFRRGETVSLQCTSGTCSFHHLEVTWFRDNHALTESGHTLQLGPLTAEDSGKYACALKTDMRTLSDAFSLLVEDGPEEAAVIYSFTRTCAVRGSTITLPCTFTPLKSGGEVQLKVVRVLWCQNHLMCNGITPSVYDSASRTNDPRYQYLGDLKGNCTLQIRDVQMKDNTVFYFRMEANDPEGHFTNMTGVNVTVVDGTQLRIKGSSKTEFKHHQTVSLQCTSGTCSFHHLEVTWFRDNHALTETGHTLQLGPLTAEDSGNYTCALKTNKKTQSEPFSLQVEDDPEEGGMGVVLMIRLVLFGVITLSTIIAASMVLRRRFPPAQQQVSSEN